MNDVYRKPKPYELMIVGIGASAGGIKALREFFRNTDQATDVAYVVILHMSPEHESNLAEVLQSSTGMRVSRVERRSELRPNCVYVISPNQSLSIVGNELIVSEINSIEERRAPVDVFFRTLASAKGPSSVAVILSGTGANGSSGLKRIKECGGCVFAQNPDEAEFSDMPKNAIATGYVDQALSVGDMPGKIAIYRERLVEVGISPRGDERREEDERGLREVLTLLRRHTGHDFSHYKNSTVARRIARRMAICEVTKLSDYAKYMHERVDEANILLRDLLISVTNFFRDKEAFDALKTKVIPRLFQEKGADDMLRVWVAGCATGEEAYSVAMLLAEAMPDVTKAPLVQIFATDIDRDAIAYARDGFYTDTACADISPERLQRFFKKETDGYRIRKELREKVLFAVHDVIKDPPFSRLDLACCRNLLIYLNRPGQERVLNTLSFALRSGGFLFSGTSESPDSAGDAFAAFDKEHRIYQARAREFRPSLNVPSISSQGRVTRTPPDGKERRAQRLSYADLHLRLLEQYAPPSVVVDENFDIVHMTESAARYMQLPGGEPSHNLLKVIASELRIELRGALYQAAQSRTCVEARNVKLADDGALDLIIRPVLRDGDSARGFVLVLLKESRDDGSADKVVLAEPIAGQLEDELTRLKAQLHDNAEQYELQNEELRASNEELQAANEELQSATEEMETSREELQSVNEELTTVNQELKVKIDELSHANDDLQNLINSTDIGTIFLDSALRIKFFTPRARDVFNLIPADRGRQLADITTKFGAGQKFLDEATQVLDTLQPFEREVSTREGTWHLMRLLPYRTHEKRINGVVATFLDVTQRKESEEALRGSEERFRAIVTQASAGVAETDLEGNFTFVNQRYCEITGYPQEELLRMRMQDITHPEDLARNLKLFERMASHGEPFEIEKRYVRKDRSTVWVNNNVTVVRDSEGEPHAALAVTLDITERKLAQEALSESKEKLRRAIEIETVGVIFFKVDGSITYSNDAFLRMSGYSREDAEGGRLRWDAMTPAEWMPQSRRAVEEFVKRGRIHPYEKEYIRKDGSRWWALFTATRLNEEEGVEYVIDISARKRAEQALRQREERYRTLFESIDEGFCLCEVIFDENGKPVDYRFLEANPVFEKYMGLKDVVGKTARQVVPQLEQWWFETYGKVASAQEASRFEHFSEAMNRWFDVYASSIGDHGGRKIAILFTDITQRKAAEQGLLKATEELAAANARLEQQVAARTALIEQRSRQLRSLAVQLTQAEAQERQRIAQVLHDHLQQVIIAAKYKLQAHASKSKDYKGVFELLDEGVKSARSLAAEIAPPALYHPNFIATLDWLSGFAKDQYGLKVKVSADPTEIALSDEQKVVLYQSARELLLNIFKHTKAKQARLRWGACRRYMILRVEDKGAGFDPAQVTEKPDAGFGLFAIRERLEALGGGLIVRSRPKRGTRIAMVLPRLRNKSSTKEKNGSRAEKTGGRLKSS
jgi:PAS domain S-box-containing protein